MYAIESGIPEPDVKIRRKRKYPFAEMQVGQSFFIPAGSIHNIRSSAAAAGKKLGRKFTVHWVEADNGFRVWRTL